MADADPQRTLAADEAAPTLAPDDLETPAAPAPRRRWGRLALMVSVPLLLAAIGGWFWLTSGRYASTDNAYVKQDMSSISPDTGGRIVSVEVRENQRVNAGDILFRIDPEPYRIALEQADAALAEARVDVSTKATDTGSAAATLAGARADLTLAQATFERQKALMTRGFTTRASLDAATQQVAAAQARIAAAQADAARARQQVSSGASGSSTPAAIQAAYARREKAALDLSRTVVRAPYAGIVSQTSRLQVGNITPSGLPALTLVALRGAYVEANFKETDLDHMRLGQPATIRLDAYPDIEMKGHVQSIGAGTGSQFSVLPAQNATGNWVKVTQRVPVRIAIDSAPPRALIAGLSADVSVDTQPGRH